MSNSSTTVTNPAVNPITIKYFGDLNVADRANSRVVTGKGITPQIQIGNQVTGIDNYFLAVCNTAYQANNMAIASQLTQIQAQNVEAKIASAVISEFRNLKVSDLGWDRGWDFGLRLGAAVLAAQGKPSADPGVQWSAANAFYKKVTGNDFLGGRNGTITTDTDITNFVTSLTQFQQNVLTQNTVLQSQLVIYQNQNQAIIELMTQMQNTFASSRHALVRNI